MFDVYLITDGPDGGPVVQAVQRALTIDAASGRIAVQLRAKAWPYEERMRAGRALRAITRDANALLFVNGDLATARAVQADGVHLPDDETPIAAVRDELGASVLIGRSCHDAPGLARAAEEGASFATLSPVFPVAGKAPSLGIDGFGVLVRGARLPIFALGGIDPTCVSALLAAGARGVAVRSCVLHAADPALALAQMLGALDLVRVLDTTRDPSRRS